MSRNLHYFHVVWATQQREPLVTQEYEQDVYRLIISLAQELRVEILAVNGMPDHVHILIKTGAVIDLPSIMKKIKGVSSAMLNRRMKPAGRFQWHEGYYSATVTPSHIAKIAAYIHGQKEHYANGTTKKFWEQTEEEEENV